MTAAAISGSDQTNTHGMLFQRFVWVLHQKAGYHEWIGEIMTVFQYSNAGSW